MTKQNRDLVVKMIEKSLQFQCKQVGHLTEPCKNSKDFRVIVYSQTENMLLHSFHGIEVAAMVNTLYSCYVTVYEGEFNPFLKGRPVLVIF